jgi:hypothetical protein
MTVPPRAGITGRERRAAPRLYPSIVSAAPEAPATLAALGAPSPRVAQAELRTRLRRLEQMRRSRVLVWPVMLLVVLPMLEGTPRPGLHGAGLTVTVCLILYAIFGTIAGLGVAGRRDSTAMRRVQPLLMGAAGVGLTSVQVSASTDAAVSSAVAMAFLCPSGRRC